MRTYGAVAFDATKMLLHTGLSEGSRRYPRNRCHFVDIFLMGLGLWILLLSCGELNVTIDHVVNISVQGVNERHW
jgi:hypothetical protein